MEIEKVADATPVDDVHVEEQGLDPKGVVAFVVAILIPGAGHALSRRWLRALLIAAVLIGGFLFALALNGHVNTFDASNYLSILFVFADAGVGLGYLFCLLTGTGLDIHAASPTYEYGTNLLYIVGLLNYLAALDAYDLAIGRKS